MKARLCVRDLSEEEQQSLSAGLRSSDAFLLRRSQILLASARGGYHPQYREGAHLAMNKRFAMPSTRSTSRDVPLCKPDQVVPTIKLPCCEKT
jgi:hypothetical protein